MKLETAPELDLNEAMFLRSKSYSLNIQKKFHIANTKEFKIMINILWQIIKIV